MLINLSGRNITFQMWIQYLRWSTIDRMSSIKQSKVEQKKDLTTVAKACVMTVFKGKILLYSILAVQEIFYALKWCVNVNRTVCIVLQNVKRKKRKKVKNKFEKSSCKVQGCCKSETSFEKEALQCSIKYVLTPAATLVRERKVKKPTIILTSSQWQGWHAKPLLAKCTL